MVHPSWLVYRYPHHGLHEAVPPRELVLVLGPTPLEGLFAVLKRMLGRGYHDGTIKAEAVTLQPKPEARCEDWCDGCRKARHGMVAPPQRKDIT